MSAQLATLPRPPGVEAIQEPWSACDRLYIARPVEESAWRERIVRALGNRSHIECELARLEKPTVSIVQSTIHRSYRTTAAEVAHQLVRSVATELDPPYSYKIERGQWIVSCQRGGFLGYRLKVPGLAEEIGRIASLASSEFLIPQEEIRAVRTPHITIARPIDRQNIPQANQTYWEIYRAMMDDPPTGLTLGPVQITYSTSPELRLAS